MDKASFSGIILALGGITLGLLLEGGKLAQVLQPTAALIVFGGTFGAVLLHFPLSTVFGAIRHVATVFFQPELDTRDIVKDIVSYAIKARREGIIALDSELPYIKDPFLRRSLMLAVDGTDPQELRKLMELELANEADRNDHLPQVFECAGGYAPTVGIIGAVLGLIQVMQHLENINEVGRGIAVAFVATIYGVGAANLLLLPMAGKLRMRFRQELLLREMTLEGVISILEGMNPRMLEIKLAAFFNPSSTAATPTRESRRAAA